MSNNKPNKASMKSVAVGYVDSNGNFQYAKSDSPLPINISAAIGAFTTPWKLNYSDISTNASSKEPIYWPYIGVVIPDEEKLYDNNINTYSYIHFTRTASIPSPINYDIYLNVPQYVKEVVLINKDTYGEAKYGNLHLFVYYEDGTNEIINPTIVPASLTYDFDVLLYSVNSTKKVVKLTLSSSEYDETSGIYVGVAQKFDCHGLYIYVNPHKTQIDMLTALQDIDAKTDVNLSQAGQKYLYNSTDGLSAYDRLKSIDNYSQQLVSDVETNDINEVKLDPWYTGDVADNLLIANTAKGTTPDITATHSFPATDSAGTTLYGTGAVIQIKKFSGGIVLNFSNSDTAAAHTAYVEVDLDGVAFTGNVSVPAAGTASLTIDVSQTDPADGDLTVDIYVWADTANVVTLDSHSIWIGVATDSTTEDPVVAINREGIQVIAASFDILDATYNYTWVMRSQTSNVRLNYLTNDDLYASDILPKTIINMYVTGSYAYVTGVTSIRRVM